MKKDLTPKQLRLFKDGDERLLASITAEAIEDIEKLHEDFIARVNARLRKLKVSESQIANDAEKMRLIRDVRTLFDQALGKRNNGTYSALQAYQRLAKRAERRALKYFERFSEPVTFGATSRETLHILLTEQSEGLLDIYDARLRRPLIQTIRAETFGLSTRDAFVNAVAEAGIELTTAQISNAVDDGFRQVHRTANKLAANDNDLLEVAVWRGPQDRKTSPQCRAMWDEAPYGAKGVWLKADLAAGPVAGLTGDVEIEGGHPGCRHNINYVDRAYAEEYLGATFPDGQ